MISEANSFSYIIRDKLLGNYNECGGRTLLPADGLHYKNSLLLDCNALGGSSQFTVMVKALWSLILTRSLVRSTSCSSLSAMAILIQIASPGMKPLPEIITSPSFFGHNRRRYHDCSELCAIVSSKFLNERRKTFMPSSEPQSEPRTEHSHRVQSGL